LKHSKVSFLEASSTGRTRYIIYIYDINHMALTETNYSVAWNLVVKRYNNPRLQFMYNMNALYGIEPLSKEIAVDLRNLLNLANVCISEFRRLHNATDSCEYWLVHHLFRKLPISTTQAWERSLGNNVEIPTFTNWRCFFTIDWSAST